MFQSRFTFLTQLAGCLLAAHQAVAFAEQQDPIDLQMRSMKIVDSEEFPLSFMHQMRARRLVARQARGTAGTQSSPDEMPARCDSQCVAFNTVLGTCSTGSETEQIACTCQASTFDAMITCAMCAPEYYSFYKDGLRGFIENAESQCAKVGHTVTVDTAALPTGRSVVTTSSTTARAAATPRTSSTPSSRSTVTVLAPDAVETRSAIGAGIGAAAQVPTASAPSGGGAFDKSGSATSTTAFTLSLVAAISGAIAYLV